MTYTLGRPSVEHPMLVYYSQWAVDQGYGSQIYLTEDGKEVEGTVLFDDEQEAEHGYHWKDKQQVGVAVRYLRQGKPREIPELPGAPE